MAVLHQPDTSDLLGGEGCARDQLPSGEIWHEFKLILSYRLPLILGNDVAGVVVQAGRHVRRFKVGDQV